jgi:hypothetical protein
VTTSSELKEELVLEAAVPLIIMQSAIHH